MRELLDKPADLNPDSQEELLSEVAEVITSADIDMLEVLPTKGEVFEALKSSNLSAPAGSDGILCLLYKECWNSLGDCLLEVIRELFSSKPPSVSMHTALMIFSSKPNISASLKPSLKRRISILNTDFNLCKGLIARRFRKISGRILSPNQYVAGKDRNIQHGIARARDAFFTANSSNW